MKESFSYFFLFYDHGVTLYNNDFINITNTNKTFL